MASIFPTSLASANAVGLNNVVFLQDANYKQRKVVIVGSYDPAKTTIVDDVPVLVNTPEQVANTYGAGFMLHRLVKWFHKEGQGIPMYVVPQSEVGTAAAGGISITGPATAAGEVVIYFCGDTEERVAVTVASGDTPTEIALALNTAINAKANLPVTSAVDGTNDYELDFTSKSEGTYGNFISIKFSLLDGEELPAGIAIAITDMAAGATDPDISTALIGLGEGDSQNQLDFTALVHGYGNVTANLNAISTYNGSGDEFSGNYAKLVARPFYSLQGDVVKAAAGQTAVLAVAAGRKLDRTNGVVVAPDSPSHPSELGAITTGAVEVVAGMVAPQNYQDIVLSGVLPGPNSTSGDRWTDDYTARDTAVKSGVGTTTLKNNAVVIQDLVTFYHPDDVAQGNNGYRDLVNIVKGQNVLALAKANFEGEKWDGVFIVADTRAVTNVAAKSKARDIDAVEDDLLLLGRQFEGLGLTYNFKFTEDRIKAGGLVTLRSGGKGFDYILPIIYSGAGGILNGEIQFDINLAAAL